MLRVFNSSRTGHNSFIHFINEVLAYALTHPMHDRRGDTAAVPYLVWPKWGWRDENVVKIRKLMLPALFGVSVSQINLLLDTVLASFLQTGSVSWLYYADRLSELPLGAFGIAVGTVILPALSRHHSTAKPEEFSATIDWALRMVLLVGVPAALALAILAEPLIATLFLYGAMTAHDVTQAAAALQAYALGVLTFMLIKVLAPGFFARQDLKTPVRIAIICMVVNMVLNLILIWPLQHVGLALATSLASMLNTGLLLRGLYRAGVYTPAPGWALFMTRLILACAAMIALVLWLNEPSSQWFAWDWQQRVWKVTLLVCGGMAVFAGTLFASGIRMRHLRR